MKWWGRARLRTKIFIAFSSLIIAVLLATLGFTQIVVSREIERTLDRDETISARRGKTRIARWMLRIFGEVSPTRHAGVLRAKGVGSNARTGSE